MANLLTCGITRRSLMKVVGLAAGCMVFIACGGTSGTVQPGATSPESRPAQTVAPKSVSLEIGTASDPTVFKYDKETLEAPAGSKITLKFSNKTALKDEVGHNWVLVKPSQEQSVLANAIAASDEKDWLKEDDPGIIAHTALIEGGVSDTITFDAPAPGAYVYLSTFPKQYDGGMKGTLTIK